MIAALRVLHFHGEHRNVLAIGVDLLAVGGEHEFGGRAYRVAALCKYLLAALEAPRFDVTGRVRHVPGEVAVLRHVLRAKALAITEQFHSVHVRIDPDGDLLAFQTRPIPVREYVQYRLRGPPGLEVEEAVFGESARVDNAVLRADVGPAVRRRLAAVVEARSEEHTSELQSLRHLVCRLLLEKKN